MQDPGTRRLPIGTVTFLFTDKEGSTQLLSATGRAYDELLERHDRILRSTIADHDGTVVNTEGDALFAVFALAPDAVGAAAAAQRALVAEDWPEGRPIRVRMGIHTGEGRRDGADYVGMDIHVAARIASVGRGGQVLLAADQARWLDRVERERPNFAAALRYLTGIDNLMAARNPMAATVLLLFAGFESQVGRHEQAVRLFAAGQAECAANGAVMPPGGSLLMGDPVGRAVEAIGRPAVDEGLAIAGAMSLEAAVAYARTGSVLGAIEAEGVRHDE